MTDRAAPLRHAGQCVKYKYVVLQADGNVRWENIPDRLFTPEGMNITLEDGDFDVERARLLNRDLVTVGGGDVGSRKSKGKIAGLDCLHSTAKIESADTIYIMTYRLPLVTTRNPETVRPSPTSRRAAPPRAPACSRRRGCGRGQGRLEFKWLSFLSDEKTRGMDATGAHQDRVTPAPPPMGGGGRFARAPGAACEAGRGRGAGGR